MGPESMDSWLEVLNDLVEESRDNAKEALMLAEETHSTLSPE